MGVKSISLAIISDIHCHHSESKNTNGVIINDSYLKSDLLRTPADNHPVESIIKLIDENYIETDLTLCPGDFTNKSERQGFISGWNFALEIHEKLKGKEIIGTIGNHDVDVYGNNSSYGLEIAKGIKRGFPIKDDAERDIFWSKGCAFIEKEDYRILVINSSHFHHSKKTAASGKVDDDLIDYVNEYMTNCDKNKISIAMSHHHPIDHSRLKLGEEDKISNADKLIEVLGDHKFDLYVHGHKHDPLLRYHNCYSNNHKLPILASGSFAAISNLSWTSKRNTFHVIDIIKEDTNNAKGRVKTWTFIPRNGWKIINDDGGFDPYTGFGFNDSLDDLVSKIETEIGTESIKMWKEIVSTIPDINYLMPNEASELDAKLKSKKLILSSKLSALPEYISNANNLNVN